MNKIKKKNNWNYKNLEKKGLSESKKNIKKKKNWWYKNMFMINDFLYGIYIFISDSNFKIIF